MPPHPTFHFSNGDLIRPVSLIRRSVGTFFFDHIYTPGCSLWPRDLSTADYGHAEHFDAFFASRRAPLTALLHRLGPAGPSQCLDLGAGTGAWALDLLREGHRVRLVDRSKRMLSVARERLKSNGVHGWTMVEGDFLTGFEPNQTYDAVFLLGNALAHAESCSKMSAVLRRVHSSLSEQGRVFIDVHHADFWETVPFWQRGRWLYWADLGTRQERARVWLRTSPLPERGRTCWENAVLRGSFRFQLLTTAVFVLEVKEWLRLFSRAGFEVDQLYGAWDARELNGTATDACFVLRALK